MGKPLESGRSKLKSLRQRLVSQQSKHLYNDKHTNPIRNVEALNALKQRITKQTS